MGRTPVAGLQLVVAAVALVVAIVEVAVAAAECLHVDAVAFEAEDDCDLTELVAEDGARVVAAGVAFAVVPAGVEVAARATHQGVQVDWRPREQHEFVG